MTNSKPPWEISLTSVRGKPKKQRLQLHADTILDMHLAFEIASAVLKAHAWNWQWDNMLLGKPQW